MSTSSSSSFDYSTTDETEDSSSECASGIDEDLEELYEYFDYDDFAPDAETDANSISSNTHDIDKTPLYPNSQLTAFQSYLLTFQCAVRHSLSVKAFTELLKLLSVHAPKGAGIHTSVHNMKRYFLETFHNANPVHHAYCSPCQRPLESVDSSCAGRGCQGGRPSVFITVPIGAHIKRKMEGMKFSFMTLLCTFVSHPCRSCNLVCSPETF